MRIVILGASGTLGTAVVELLAVDHEITGLSRTTSPPVDLTDVASLRAAITATAGIDAVICCAAGAPLATLDDDGFMAGLEPKLLDQVQLTRLAAANLTDQGSITLTSGAIPAGLAVAPAARWSTPA